MRLRACALVIGMCSLGLPAIVHAADSSVDDGLLEFLGSVDSDDKNWHDYLAGTDIDQVARGARGARSAGSAPPPRSVAPAPAAATPAGPAAASAPPPVSQP